MNDLIKASRKVLANIERLYRFRCIGSILTGDSRTSIRLDRKALANLRNVLIKLESGRKAE